MNGTMDQEALREKVNSLPWYHEIDFGGGVLSPGQSKNEWLRSMADVYFDEPLEGSSVLDIGCWDGFNSFEAARRGAKRVLATDHYAWSPQCWGSRESFELARTHLAPEVEVLDIDVPDLRSETVGTFDVVLFCGVLYHLRHPFAALEQISRLVTRTLVVETRMDAQGLDRPAMIFYPTNELGNDASNWWGPNRACVEAMLRDVGFARVLFTPTPFQPTRGIFHARR
jgi:tRNA (mo5U34)-methyltransferase